MVPFSIILVGEFCVTIYKLGQKAVNLIYPGKQQTVDTVGFRAIARPDSATSLVGFLVPVSQPDKDIHTLAYHLPVPGVFKLDKILFGRINLTPDMQAVASQWI